MQIILIARSLIILLFLLGCLPNTVSAETKAVPDASGTTLFDLISDHTLTGKTRADDTFYQYFRFDGVAFQRVPRPNGKVVHDMGAWRVDGDRLCRKWTIRSRGREKCTLVRVDGNKIEIIGRKKTRVSPRIFGDIHNLASIEKTGANVDRSGKRKKIAVIYISAWDCPTCQFLENDIVPNLSNELASKGVSFRKVDVHTFADIKEAARWPTDLNWLRTKMKATRGTPRWFVIRGRRVVAHFRGQSGPSSIRSKLNEIRDTQGNMAQ